MIFMTTHGQNITTERTTTVTTTEATTNRTNEKLPSPVKGLPICSSL